MTRPSGPTVSTNGDTGTTALFVSVLARSLRDLEALPAHELVSQKMQDLPCQPKFQAHSNHWTLGGSTAILEPS